MFHRVDFCNYCKIKKADSFIQGESFSDSYSRIIVINQIKDHWYLIANNDPCPDLNKLCDEELLDMDNAMNERVCSLT